MESLIAPFDAYKGDKPYIFVSYAHRNSKVIFRHITRLRDEGFRIWYDEGIDPGTDWSDEIANALANAASFLVFVSPEMVESHNVKKEIVFALSKKKHMIAVHIAETILPAGLEMQLSNIQALLEKRFNDKEKFYERLFAALPIATRGNEITETGKNRLSNDSPKGFWSLFKRNKNKVSELSQENSDIVIEKTESEVKPTEVIEIKAEEVSGEKPSSPPLEKEMEKQVEHPIVQPKEYQNNVEEEGVISFFPSGTLIIKTISGEEYKAILNTVSGFPVSIYKDGTEHKLMLEDFCKAEFVYQNKENNAKALTISTYNENNQETVFIEDYEVLSYSSIGAISFLTSDGMRFLSLNQVEQITKDENETPEMPENTRYMYIRSGGMVYKVPQSLLKYEHMYFSGYTPFTEVYHGLPHCGGDIFRINSLKYIRICKEADGFRKSNNSVYVNVYFTDDSMISTSLMCDSYYNSSIVASTILGEIRSMIANIDEIFFDNYDIDFAKKVATDAWDGSKAVSLTEKGVATIHKNDGTKSVLVLDSLVSIGTAGRRMNSYPTKYLKADNELYRAEIGIDLPPLFFGDTKNLRIKKIDNNLIADYLLYSGETGEKRILDYQLEGLTENGKENINWEDIEKIDFDNNRKVDLSQFKKAIITSSNGCVFETLQLLLYFRYSYSSGGIPSFNNEQKVKIEGGLSITYDKIKKIEFLPAKQDGDKTRYPAKITLRVGGSQELMLDIAGYYNSYLQFLTPIGVFNLNLRRDVKCIEIIN